MSIDNLLNSSRRAALGDLFYGFGAKRRCLTKFQDPTSPVRACLAEANKPSPMEKYLGLLPDGMPSPEQRDFVLGEVNQPAQKPVKASCGISKLTVLTPKTVFQLTTPEELAGELLYRSLGANAPFQFPKIQGFDLEQNTCVEPNRTTPLEASAARVSLAASTLFKPFRKKEHADFHTVIEAERIEGQNLREFIASQYMGLSDEDKNSLFQTLGSLALLDIVLGNGDRLICFEGLGHDDYALFPEDEANLENVMVKGTTIFAIDNVPTQKNSEQYLQFLETTLSSLDAIAPNIGNSIHKYFLVQDCPLDRATLQSLRTDLDLFGIRCIGEGIQQMQGVFLRDILPCWHSEQAGQSKAVITALDPTLVEIIDRRLTTVECALRARASSTGISHELLSPFSALGRFDSTTPLVSTPLCPQDNKDPF